MTERSGAERGQATVELVALLPLLLAAGLAAATLLAARSAHEHAGQAAQAGAMALLQGGDPRAAASDALPAEARARTTITVRGHRVEIGLHPRSPIPGPGAALAASATADAGPAPAP